MVVDIEVPEQFKGPMDLLLYLIKRDEIEIHDIPISHITNEYMKVLSQLEELDVEVGAEFVNIASMLMEIKSKMLLPPEEVEDDEETVELDPRAGLVEALLEYKRFKEAAGELDELYEMQKRRFPRIAPADEIREVVPDEQMIDASADDLYFAFLKLLEERRTPEADTIVATEMSTEDAIETISDQLKIAGGIPFSKLFSDVHDRHTMVVYFVALLELVRLRKIRAYQSDIFNEIYLEERDDQPHSINLFATRPLGYPHTRSGKRTGRKALILHIPRLLFAGVGNISRQVFHSIAPFLALHFLKSPVSLAPTRRTESFLSINPTRRRVTDKKKIRLAVSTLPPHGVKPGAQSGTYRMEGTPLTEAKTVSPDSPSRPEPEIDKIINHKTDADNNYAHNATSITAISDPLFGNKSQRPGREKAPDNKRQPCPFPAASQRTVKSKSPTRVKRRTNIFP